MRRRQVQAGFTLIELVISLAIVVLVVVFSTDLMVRQQRSYHVVEQVTNAQQNMRVIAHLLEREIRSTGFLVDRASAICGRDATNAPDVLYLTDASALTTGATVAMGAQVIAGYTGAGTDTITVDDVVLDGNPFYDTDGDTVPDSDFRVGSAAIIVDRADTSRGTACGSITRVTPNSIDVDFATNGSALGAFTSIPDLIAVPAHIYSIDVANTRLMRDGMLLSEGVEDLQVAFFYDLDDDGIMDGENLEYPGSPTGNVYQSGSWDNTLLREVRVSFVVRSKGQDVNFPTGQFQARENRVAPAGTDGFRRRVFTAAVRPRNVVERWGG